MDGTNGLRKIEKEIVEARALVIKSNNLVNSLSAEVRSIARRQSSYERSLSINSFVAYLVFATLAIIGAQLVYNARQAPLEEKLNQAQKEAEDAQKALTRLKKETGSNPEQSDKKLVELYRLISRGQREEAISTFKEVNRKSLSFLEKNLLIDAIEGFKGDLSLKHYLKARKLVEEKKLPEAIEEFKVSLRYKESTGHSKTAKIEMANALRLQGKPREAIAILQKVTEEHLNRELSDDALWHLAQSHEDAHQKDEALSVLKTLMRRHPDSQYYRNARIRAAELKLRMWRSD